MLDDHEEDRVVFDFTSTKEEIVDEVHNSLNKLNHRHFEQLIEAYLKSLGADVTEIPSTNAKVNTNDRIADVDVKTAFNNLDI